MAQTIKLTDIPNCLLPTLTNSEKTAEHIYLKGQIVESIIIFDHKYWIYAGKEHQYPLDTDLILEIY